MGDRQGELLAGWVPALKFLDPDFPRDRLNAVESQYRIL
jgi:hypothetical protein